MAGPLGRTLGLKPGSVTATHTLTPLGPQFLHLSKKGNNLALSAFGVGQGDKERSRYHTELGQGHSRAVFKQGEKEQV